VKPAAGVQVVGVVGVVSLVVLIVVVIEIFAGCRLRLLRWLRSSAYHYELKLPHHGYLFKFNEQSEDIIDNDRFSIISAT